MRAKRFLLATGSSPFVPPIDGLDSVPYLTNETVFDLEELPRRLAVLGAGPIGLELSKRFKQLGAEVEVLQSAPKLLPRLDKEMAEILAVSLAESGLRLHFNVNTQRVEKRGDEIFLEADTPSGKREWVCDQLLIATGRSPNVAGMDLERAGVTALRAAWRPMRIFKRRITRIFAAGDIRGQYLFTHMAEYEAGVALRNMLFSAPFGVPLPFLKKKTNYDAVPWTIYTTPEAAHVGLSEADAEAALGANRIQVFRFPMSRVDRAVLDGETEGICKVVCDEKGRLVGADLVGPAAGEILHEFALAVRQEDAHQGSGGDGSRVSHPGAGEQEGGGPVLCRKTLYAGLQEEDAALFGLKGSIEVTDPADLNGHGAGE